jgi:L-fucose isomerase-like protein
MKNLPDINLGIVAVSRDCFSVELSRSRREKVVKECAAKKISITEIDTVVENEKDSLKALKEIKSKNIDALVIYLGNFGPEGPTTLLAQRFDGPVMFVAAAEETKDNLIHGRGDAFCGMLNTSYNVGLRKNRRLCSCGPDHKRPEKTQDFCIRSQAPRFSGLQCPDQTPV